MIVNSLKKHIVVVDIEGFPKAFVNLVHERFADTNAYFSSDIK